jgi:haloalkane dehalogenase
MWCAEPRRRRSGTDPMDVFRTPDERFDDLPGYDFEPHYAEVDGLRLHYVDESSNGGGRPIVCFHGEPTWAYLYRKMLRPLVQGGNRVICPDYAGFGRSDKPTDRGWYSFEGHLRLMSELLAALELSDAVVMVQDWGGPIGLSWAVQNAERVGALVILNTGLFLGRVTKAFIAWRNFAERNPDLPIGFVIQGATTTELPDEVLAGYDAPFPTPESKAGSAQFPLLVPMEEDAPMAVQQRELAEELRRWDKPALVAFSDSDPVFPYPRAGERFVQWIPTVSEQVRVEGAAHFLQEDRGEQIAAEILRFLA